MSSKIGLIASMLFLTLFILLGEDMICLSSIYSTLDSNSITIGYLIAKTGRVDSDYISYLESKFKVTFLSVSPETPTSGDVIEFTIYKMFDPLIISSSPIRLIASRTTIIGYYG